MHARTVLGNSEGNVHSQFSAESKVFWNVEYREGRELIGSSPAWKEQLH